MKASFSAATASALILIILLPMLAQEDADPSEDAITNSIGMKFRLIPPGSFVMGSDAEEVLYHAKPAHRVTITKPFYIGVHEVTQEQYVKVMDNNRSRFPGPDLPVEMISWEDAKEFCYRLSENEGVTYRLPTEAEWEYACRGGSVTDFFWGNDFDEIYAWYYENSDRQTHPVGRKEPNAWGLHDMLGNVGEFCEDFWGDYPDGESVDPKGPESGFARVVRGGSWNYRPVHLRVFCRFEYPPDRRNTFTGFRVVREVE